jgi:DNA-binding NarL/FixJ family response regulator
VIRVLVADDHPIMRRGLEQLIDAEPDMRVMKEASDGREVIELLNREQFDVLVLDISMPRINGIKEIAADLCLSNKTISTYRTRILTKLGISAAPSAFESMLPDIRTWRGVPPKSRNTSPSPA